MPETAFQGSAVPSAEGALSAEDTKLVTLARSARARVGAVEGAAVRDQDGRTYAAASVVLPSMSVTALQLAVASAVAVGRQQPGGGGGGHRGVDAGRRGARGRA